MKVKLFSYLHILFILFCLFDNKAFASEDLLPSWNNGYAKTAILQFIKETTNKEHPNYIPIENRIAVFDQDGTLWVEQPLYTQFFFAIDSIKASAINHPEWKMLDPYRSILEGHIDFLKSFTEQDIEKLISATHASIKVDEFQAKVRAWLKTAIHPRFKKPFTDLVYQPMLEVISLFQEKNFKTYIVSGSGQEFIRVYAAEIYGIPPEQVIGSAGKIQYTYENGRPFLIKLPETLFIDDKAGKPEAISLIIGRRPYAAFGNSIGDQQMLEWTQAGNQKRLELLVYHDDAEREYAYGADSKIGTFSLSLMEEAKKRHWIVVSMKHDWKVIFPWQKNQ